VTHPRLLNCLPAALLLLAASPALPQDLANGREINEICAGCHGQFGQGGKDGEYPRLAGQRALYIEEQLLAFRARKRVNIPMLPYTQPRELGDDDIADIAAYLASIRLTARPPTFADSADARQRRAALDRVFRIERIEGDIIQGRGLYNAECGNCHGKTGQGRSNFPMLAGQYPNYLKRQIEAYRRGDRPHDEALPAKGVLMPLTEVDLTNILAYLSSIQEPDEPAP
jgi:cytochrome c553